MSEERIYVSLKFPRLQQHNCPTRWCNKNQCWYFKCYKDFRPYEDYMSPFMIHFINVPDDQMSYARKHCPTLFFNRQTQLYEVSDEDLHKLQDMFPEK